MKRKLFAHKCGDLQTGRWEWALAAENTTSKLPYIVAVMNFHGSLSAGYDPEELVQQIADNINKENGL